MRRGRADAVGAGIQKFLARWLVRAGAAFLLHLQGCFFGHKAARDKLAEIQAHPERELKEF